MGGGTECELEEPPTPDRNRGRLRSDPPHRYAGGGKGRPARDDGNHAAVSSVAAAATGCMSRIFTRALIVPLRPSSKVTCVEMSASVEPS